MIIKKKTYIERKVLRVKSGYFLIAAETTQRTSNLLKVCSLVAAGKDPEIEMLSPYF